MSAMVATETRSLDQIDIHSVDRYVDEGYPWADWDLLRAEAPVYWYERPGFPPFWAVTRYDDIHTVESNPTVFINGGPILRLDTNYGLERLAAFHKRDVERHGWDPTEPFDLVYMDRPKHLDMRLLTMRGFTPAAMRRLETELAELAEHFVGQFMDKVRAGGVVDVVNDLSVGVPLATICGLMGLPVDDWPDIHRWTDVLFIPDGMMDYAQPGETRKDVRRRLGREWFDYIEGIITDRRERGPDAGDDLATQLVFATINGEPLTQQQLHGYLMLLIGAGNETTRNATTGGLQVLLEHPDQAAILESDPDAHVETAVDEILRWTSPVIQFARTATEDFELAGTVIRQGDTVGLWYPSANRDERQFDEPYRFDVTRDPNYHLAFGHGQHFCLGANLAKWELRAVFRALAPHLHELELAGEPTRLPHLHVGAIKHLPVRAAS